MKNKIIFLITFFIILENFNLSNASEQFNFDVTEVEITEDGNKFKGIKKGTATTEDGLIITADTFEYDKILNILYVYDNIIFDDINQKIIIQSDKATYLKNQEKIFTEGNSKAYNNDGLIITADNFRYDKISDVINAKGNVKVYDPIENYTIESEEIDYYRKSEKIITNGHTEAIVDNKYEIDSKNVTFLRNENLVSSSKETRLFDNNDNIEYLLNKFTYLTKEKILKGKNIRVTTKLDKDKSDKFIFKDGMVNLQENTFIATNTKVKIHKSVFENDKNDPRLSGVSSVGDNDKIIIKKGIFTSCKENDNCPPWSIKAQKITHDKKKRQIIYNNSILNIFDFPVFYFPKFFHPDPTVKRQSGILQPASSHSKTLGSSIYIPYYHVISGNRDITFKPTLFNDDKIILQTEYRQKNKYSSFISDFSLLKDYKPKKEIKKKNVTHLFANYETNLDFERFKKSDLSFSIQQVSNDNYLKTFEKYIYDTPVIPNSTDTLTSEINLFLDHKKFNLVSGFKAHKNLNNNKKSDQYQFVLPYYNFTQSFIPKKFVSSINLYSSGENTLSNTSSLRSSVTNDVSINSYDYITGFGLSSNFGAHFKNLNVIGKKDNIYEEKIDTSAMSLFEISSSYPLIKSDLKNNYSITPKFSLRHSPSKIKKGEVGNRVDITNAFSINRLAISDAFEPGESLTIGVDYKREKELDIEKFFEFRLATIYRNKEEKNISSGSTTNEKRSNLLGQINNNYFDYVKFNYNFSVDNDYSTFEHNDFTTKIEINNFVTSFRFIEQNGKVGDSNSIENNTSFNFNEQNSIRFSTRKNRKIDLTEYYNLIYEYQTDCLIASFEYNKKFYEDRNLVPSENLFLSLTIYPITTYERSLYKK